MINNLKNTKIRLISSSSYFLFAFLLISLFFEPVVAQMPDFSNKDMKKLEKAEELKNEAEELQLKANELYLEASVLQQDEEFDISKKLQKEAGKLEKQALKNEEEAADLFEESAELKKEVYSSSIEAFWKNYDGSEEDYTNAKLIEETADEYFFRANEIRRDASKIKDDKDAVLKHNEAYELELIALEKLKSAYDIYKYGPSGIVTYPDEEVNEETHTMAESKKPASTELPEEQIAETGTQVNPEPGEVNVDQQQLGMITDHLERRETTNDSAARFHPSSLITGFDTESLRTSMEAYQSMQMPESTYEPAEEIEITDAADTAFTSSENQEADPAKPMESDGPVEIGEVTESIVPDPNSVIIYKVQLAADRAPINQNVLKKLYYGDREIERINEDGWYKYSIGDFDTYEKADAFRKSLGVKDAFVVAYRGAKRLKDYQEETPELLAETTESTPEVKEIRPTAIKSNKAKIDYFVQIAASKSPIKENQLNDLYRGNKKIKMRQEEGWYKYQIGELPSLSLAKQTLKNTSVQGAFIIAYKGDKKINPWQTERNNYQSSDIVFVLQIAASKSPLIESEIKQLYNGNKQVREIRENGWYKYHIVAGPTYNDVRRLKNLLKIQGAFAVAYQNGIKLDIRKAIELTK